MLSKCHSKEIIIDQQNIKRCSFCLSESKPKLNIRLFLIIGFLSIIMLGASTSINNSKVMFLISSNELIEDNCDIILSDSILYHQLMIDSCISPLIASSVIQQFRLESNNYKSYICLHYKNLGGVISHNCPYVIADSNGFAVFKDYKSCLKCHILVQKNYTDHLDKKYSDKRNYSQLIKKI